MAEIHSHKLLSSLAETILKVCRDWLDSDCDLTVQGQLNVNLSSGEKYEYVIDERLAMCKQQKLSWDSYSTVSVPSQRLPVPLYVGQDDEDDDDCDDKYADRNVVKSTNMFDHSVSSSIVASIDQVFPQPTIETAKPIEDLKSYVEQRTPESAQFEGLIEEKYSTTQEGLSLNVPQSLIQLPKNFSEFLFTCNICNKGCKSQTGLERHQRKHTADARRYIQCESCPKTFMSHKAFKSHQLTHTKPYTCVHCNRKFANKQAVEYHLNTHVSDVDRSFFLCEFCTKSFISKNGLQHHINFHHLKLRPFECATCQKRFSTRQLLRKHEQIHTGEGKCVCNVCGKTFSSNRNMVEHKKLHLGVKPFACNFCGKTFATKVCRDDHHRTHTGEKPFGCPMCDEKFATQSGLHKHKKTWHTDRSLRPYQCNICSKTFRLKSHLREHSKTHMDRPSVSYACDLCPNVYANSNGLRRHKKQVHSA